MSKPDEPSISSRDFDALLQRAAALQADREVEFSEEDLIRAGREIDIDESTSRTVYRAFLRRRAELERLPLRPLGTRIVLDASLDTLTVKCAPPNVQGLAIAIPFMVLACAVAVGYRAGVTGLGWAAAPFLPIIYLLARGRTERIELNHREGRIVETIGGVRVRSVPLVPAQISVRVEEEHVEPRGDSQVLIPGRVILYNGSHRHEMMEGLSPPELLWIRRSIEQWLSANISGDA